jgi:uncharacterized membrane protein
MAEDQQEELDFGGPIFTMETLLPALAACVVGGIMVFIFVYYEKVKRGKELTQLQPKHADNKAERERGQRGEYTVAEVAKHSKQTDAWIIIQERTSKEWRV